jgi:hypothetical protein
MSINLEAETNSGVAIGAIPLTEEQAKATDKRRRPTTPIKPDEIRRKIKRATDANLDQLMVKNKIEGIQMR